MGLFGGNQGSGYGGMQQGGGFGGSRMGGFGRSMGRMGGGGYGGSRYGGGGYGGGYGGPQMGGGGGWGGGPSMGQRMPPSGGPSDYNWGHGGAGPRSTGSDYRQDVRTPGLGGGAEGGPSRQPPRGGGPSPFTPQGGDMLFRRPGAGAQTGGTNVATVDPSQYPVSYPATPAAGADTQTVAAPNRGGVRTPPQRGQYGGMTEDEYTKLALSRGAGPGIA